MTYADKFTRFTPDMVIKLSQKLTNPIGFTGRVAQRLHAPPPLLPRREELSIGRALIQTNGQIDGVGGNYIQK